MMRKAYKRSLLVNYVKRKLSNSIFSRMWMLILKNKKLKRKKRQKGKPQHGYPVSQEMTTQLNDC